MTLTPIDLWANTRKYVKNQLPNASTQTIDEVASKVYQEMEFLLEAQGYRAIGSADVGKRP